MSAGLDGYSQKAAWECTSSTLRQQQCQYGNINPLSIAYATRLGLGPTNPGMTIIAQETSPFRRERFSLSYWLLIPAFSLSTAPPNLAVRLQC